MASEATALTAVEAAAAAPEASAPTKIDDVSLDALDAARGCAYAVFFSLSVAWGIWAEVYTFFLEGVGGYGPDHAAAISSSLSQRAAKPSIGLTGVTPAPSAAAPPAPAPPAWSS